jgi:hypothetical protein
MNGYETGWAVESVGASSRHSADRRVHPAAVLLMAQELTEVMEAADLLTTELTE